MQKLLGKCVKGDNIMVEYTPEVTYYNASRSGSGIKYGIIVFVILMAWAVYFCYRAYKIYLIKKACTTEVFATVAKINNSSHANDFVRYKYRRYTAIYRYEYNNQTVTGSNNCYGSMKTAKKIQEGDYVLVDIDPRNPALVYDDLAQSAFRFFLFTGIECTVLAFVTLITFWLT